MSLISWHTLNDTLSNNIANGIPLRNYGCVSDNSGKIGKCYSFNAINNYMEASIPFTNKSYSFSAWGYLTSNSVSCMLFSLNNGGGPDLYMTTGIVCWNTGDSSSNPFKNGSTNCPIPSLNTWHLYTVLSNKELGIVELYIDGNYKGKAVYKNTTSDKLIIGNYNVNKDGYYWRGKINDFRVYDHILSVAEIQELKCAKILHYTFNNLIETKSNVVAQSFSIYNNFSSRGVSASITPLGETYNGMSVYRLRMTATTTEGASNLNNQSLSNKGVFNTPSMSLTTDSKWAFGLYYKPVTHSNIVVGGTASNIGGWSNVSAVDVGDGWKRVGQVRSETPSKSDSIFTSWYVPNSNFGVNSYVEIDFACPMLIKGVNKIPDEFVNPNKTYNMISDNSGYGNDVVLSDNQFKGWETTDVPRNYGKYRFDGTNNITTNKLFFDNINQSWSVSCWVKLTEECNYSQLNNWNSGNFIQYGTSKKGLLYLNSDANNAYAYTSGTLPLNTWMMLTFVHDRATLTCRVYKDGALYGQSNNYAASDMPSGFPSSTVFGINIKGYMTDIRVYAHMLTPEEVSSLYDAPISVDSSGNINISCIDTTKTSHGIYKSGIINSSSIQEAFTPGLTSVLDDSSATKSIECRWNSTTKKMECRGTTSFTCLSIAMTTAWRTDIDPKIFKQRVVCEFSDGLSINCNEVCEK